MEASKPIKRLKTRWSGVVLVCGKCQRKLKGGFGPGASRPLSKVLRRALRDRHADRASVTTEGRKARRPRPLVIETKCLDVCPKGAVVVLPAGADGGTFVVPRGSSVAQIMVELGFEARETVSTAGGELDLRNGHSSPLRTRSD